MKRIPLFRLVALCCLVSLPLAAANLVIVATDAPGQGLNDPTPATPVGGNTGTTLGAQRLIVFQEAARIWGGLVPSNVTIQVAVSFVPLTCTTTSAVLGRAGATQIFADFPNAPVAGTFYAQSLADKFKGSELGTGPAITGTFNSMLGSTGCFDGIFFYLGLDNNHGEDINLLSVALHEIGHGLGFASYTSQAGSFSGGEPGIFDRFIYDATQAKTWDQMTGTQRATSAVNTGNLMWNGPSANAFGASYLGKRPRLLVTGDAAVSGVYTTGSAQFGPPLQSPNVIGPIAVALSGSATDACSAVTSNLTGQVALVDRGNCTFVLKAKNAQIAGAIGVIIADNTAEPVFAMAGTDPTITIPTVLVSQADGATMRANLPATADLGVDATQVAGADASGRLLLYAPNPYVPASSISHWDTSAVPSLLMEPFIPSDLPLTLDALLPALRDIGWFLGSQTIPTTYVLPSSAHSTGLNGAFYTTDLTITNTGTFDSTFTLKFLGHDQDGTSGAQVTKTLAAGHTVTYTDVLGSLFGVGPAGGYGAIRISADSSALKVVSQTSTPPPSGIGTFGQAVPAQGPNDFVTTAFPRALLGLRQDAAFRTNAVVANATEAAAHVDLKLMSQAGTTFGTMGLDLQPLEMRQISGVVTALGAASGTSDAVLVVSTPTAGAQIATYATVIDQSTNDPRTILGDILGAFAPGVSSTYLLPSSAHGSGANGAFYTTDVTLSNQDTADATVTMKFLGHDQDGSTGAEVVRTVGAGQSVAFSDVLGSLFGVSSDYGAIRFSTDTTSLKVVSQTSTPTPSGIGTFGQSVPALGPADYVTSYTPRSLVGLRQDSSFRTNAVVANATDQPTHVDLTLLSSSGTAFGTMGIDLLPYEMHQVNAVVTALGAPQGTSNAVLVVSSPTAAARVAAYATIIDQQTNDPRTVLP